MFRIRTAIAAAAVAIVAGLAFAAPASAHDTITSSSPAADEQLASAPEQVVLTFSNELLALEENSGTAMTVADESGKDWVAGAPVVAADTVTVPLESGMPNGSYLVTWKVVSSDGHPTSGEYSFTIAADESAAETAAPEESAAPTETEQAAEPEPTVTPISTPVDAAPWPLIIGLGVVVLAAVVVLVVVLVRRKR